ncbi:polyprenyl synthetase family protein [Sorangium sp. So ce381]|uniref:polyprenyl synthetase family protein n=1 Tax=Sorangium sp. So ce381 TaxID=3133307 RepID=UPI003F5AF311
MTPAELIHYLEECRALAAAEIRRIIPADRRSGGALYELMLDYPLREAKGLRPALCIATCRALGGKLEAVVRSAAVLELYHNAFLIHDDIEDESLMRRGGMTLHRAHGVPIAVNVGDAMLALSLQPLLDNVGVIGLGPSLRILQTVARMTRESVEGQALELDWVRREVWDLSDDDYIHMVEQKTCWYSFITPVVLGAIAARLDPERTERIAEFARRLGVAFQIQDDVLNLAGDVGEYGKEIGGDLWEGKRTLMLLHMMRHATPEERAEAARILSLARPRGVEGEPAVPPAIDATLARLVDRGELTPTGRDQVRAALEEAHRGGGAVKTTEQVRFLQELIARYDSIEHARAVARAWVEEAQRALDACKGWLLPSAHRDLLEALVSYVLDRVR